MSKDIREDGALGHELWREEADRVAIERRMAIQAAIDAKNGVERAFEDNRLGYLRSFVPEEEE